MSPFLLAAMFYIYILYSLKANKYYVGLTSDVNRRLEEHNDTSKVNKYTSKYLPWKLVMFFEVSESRGEALIVERFIKKQKSRVFLEKLISQKENNEYFISFVKNILGRKQLV